MPGMSVDLDCCGKSVRAKMIRVCIRLLMAMSSVAADGHFEAQTTHERKNELLRLIAVGNEMLNGEGLEP